jgi:hypothetical protein
MWRTVIKKGGLLAIGSLLLVPGTARAATVDVKIPFAFVVHGQTLPAGQYRIQDHPGSDVVWISADKGKTSLFVMATPAPGRDPSGNQASLTFTRHETQYRLADIWESGQRGLEIPASK